MWHCDWDNDEGERGRSALAESLVAGLHRLRVVSTVPQRVRISCHGVRTAVIAGIRENLDRLPAGGGCSGNGVVGFQPYSRNISTTWVPNDVDVEHVGRLQSSCAKTSGPYLTVCHTVSV